MNKESDCITQLPPIATNSKKTCSATWKAIKKFALVQGVDIQRNVVVDVNNVCVSDVVFLTWSIPAN